MPFHLILFFFVDSRWTGAMIGYLLRHRLSTSDDEEVEQTARLEDRGSSPPFAFIRPMLGIVVKEALLYLDVIRICSCMRDPRFHAGGIHRWPAGLHKLPLACSWYLSVSQRRVTLSSHLRHIVPSPVLHNSGCNTHDEYVQAVACNMYVNQVI
ncbi:hypothetical protein F5B22DRAFT_246052 [Xylaria bambusicola]|uniref:uncharacterized protein n=1 Tax=Xylaria bambusicola TaxID=326684 RepID=UPI002008A337|nr:uncharacterized protein F5B22DRAFT_246052 [Xylaria bambusicola]KAI0513248.1 hypothetical protein F5B22DRAFT_246052 [Xylaria bambusicola]